MEKGVNGTFRVIQQPCTFENLTISTNLLRSVFYDSDFHHCQTLLCLIITIPQ